MTDQQAHTPGPWELRPFSDSLGYDCMTGGWAIKDAEHRSVVVVDQADYGQIRCDFTFHSPQAEANARLIAAAPDMLAALKGLLEAVWPHVEDENHEVEYCRAARAAIDKAEGITKGAT